MISATALRSILPHIARENLAEIWRGVWIGEGAPASAIRRARRVAGSQPRADTASADISRSDGQGAFDRLRCSSG